MNQKTEQLIREARRAIAPDRRRPVIPSFADMRAMHRKLRNQEETHAQNAPESLVSDATPPDVQPAPKKRTGGRTARKTAVVEDTNA